MGMFAAPLMWLAFAALALVAERAVVRGLRTAWLAHAPVSGEHTDSVVYHRSLWTAGQPDLLAMGAALVVSGWLLAAAWQFARWPLWPAPLVWLAALGWDLWRWERAAASVKFVSWQRGWQHSTRRVAVSELREVNVVERRFACPGLPAWAQPGSCYLALMLRDEKAIKLPRTGVWFGGLARVEDLANFVRLQMDMVADNRRRAAADKRAAARRALQPVEPAHPATKIDPLAVHRGGSLR